MSMVVLWASIISADGSSLVVYCRYESYRRYVMIVSIPVVFEVILWRVLQPYI